MQLCKYWGGHYTVPCGALLHTGFPGAREQDQCSEDSMVGWPWPTLLPIISLRKNANRGEIIFKYIERALVKLWIFSALTPKTKSETNINTHQE